MVAYIPSTFRWMGFTLRFIKMRSYKNELSAEELIVYVARVSNPSNQLNSETSDKLIAYMVKNKHWSPFSLCNIKNSNSAGN